MSSKPCACKNGHKYFVSQIPSDGKCAFCGAQIWCKIDTELPEGSKARRRQKVPWLDL